MKNLKRLLFFIVGICLLISCKKTYDWSYLDLRDPGPVKHTMPINASFSGNNMVFFPDMNLCGANPMMRVLAECSGTDANLGNFTIYWDYCCDEEEGCFNTPGTIAATLVAANWDELFISSWGTMCLPEANDPPDIVKKWNTPLLFNGGTGVYEGASGGGVYNGQIYNHKAGEPQYGGTFEGTLIMVKKD